MAEPYSDEDARYRHRLSLASRSRSCLRLGWAMSRRCTRWCTSRSTQCRRLRALGVWVFRRPRARGGGCAGSAAKSLGRVSTAVGPKADLPWAGLLIGWRRHPRRRGPERPRLRLGEHAGGRTGGGEPAHVRDGDQDELDARAPPDRRDQGPDPGCRRLGGDLRPVHRVRRDVSTPRSTSTSTTRALRPRQREPGGRCGQEEVPRHPAEDRG